ncbi:hypothetical protein Scep_011362 [Stephania cephalantha]|uniref:Uncharacterized protein n=1 Tax=Stephania cephalantha TaxID=152367 RepID=A0AAP0JD36_9MAGN
MREDPASDEHAEAREGEERRAPAIPARRWREAELPSVDSEQAARGSRAATSERSSAQHSAQRWRRRAQEDVAARDARGATSTSGGDSDAAAGRIGSDGVRTRRRDATRRRARRRWTFARWKATTMAMDSAVGVSGERRAAGSVRGGGDGGSEREEVTAGVRGRGRGLCDGCGSERERERKRIV